ncbi:Uma2 family endonuclease [bacterium]|nr:Uma2 family endonuclease [bacterium]
MPETKVVVAPRGKMPGHLLDLAPWTMICTDRPVTVDEFYEMVDEDTNAELVEGVIIMKSPVSCKHETLFGFLYTMLKQYVREKNLGQVFGSRTAVRITNHTAREPDLLFVRKEHFDIIHKNDIKGAPDLVIEIVSPHDKPYEMVAKQAEYEQIGVREFWLIDQLEQRILIYDLGPDGRFVERVSQGDILESVTVDGFWIRIKWLWSELGEFPSTLSIVRDLVKNS